GKVVQPPKVNGMCGAMTDGGFDRWVKVYLDDFLRLGRQKSPNDLVKRAIAVSKAETGAEFRKALFLGVSSILHANGWEEESQTWSLRAVDEFPDDPIVYASMAMKPLINPLRDPTRGELNQALERNLQALQKARTSNSWRR